MNKDLYKQYKDILSKASGVEYVGDGWYKIINDCLAQLLVVLIPTKAEVVQIKEKFGTLRIYVEWNGDSGKTPYDIVNKVITEAENKSAITCEECGQPGTIDKSFPWVKTLCDKCKEERANEMQRRN